MNLREDELHYRASSGDRYGCWVGASGGWRLVFSSKLKRHSRWAAVKYKRGGWSARWGKLSAGDYKEGSEPCDL